MAPVHRHFFRSTLFSPAYFSKRKGGWTKPSTATNYATTSSPPPSNFFPGQMEQTLPMVDSASKSKEAVQCIRLIIITSVISGVLLGALAIGITALVFSLHQINEQETVIVSDVPTGTILLYSGTASSLIDSDDQWLFCDGSAVSRSTYRALFVAIGTMYGQGNGVDTFNLPDFRSQFPLGSSVSNQSPLSSGGSATHTLIVAELPSHNHDQGTLVTAASGVHTHTYTDPTHNHGGSTGTGPFGTGANSLTGGFGSGSDTNTHTHTITAGSIGITIQNSVSHTHTITGNTGSTGGGQAFDKMPPYQTVHYIIRM